MSISLRSRFWRALLRAVFKKRRLSIPELRANGVKNSKMLGGVSKGMKIEKVNIDGIQVEWLIPVNASHEKVILYLHGGGYVTGSIEDHRMMCGLLANSTQAQVLSITGVSPCPGASLPAALDDSQSLSMAIGSGIFIQKHYCHWRFCRQQMSVATVLALKEKSSHSPPQSCACHPG